MGKFIRPEPVDNEILLDETKILMSKTDGKGIIEYANQYFMDICGYAEWDLMGEPYDVIHHPDMPRVVLKILWDRLRKGENIHALVKNLAKNGSYYWVVTNFETKYDAEGKIIAHFSRRKKPPSYAVEGILPVYKILLDIEKTKGMEASEKYLMNFLEDKGLSYDEFILQVLKVNQEQLDIYFSDAY